MTRESLKAYYMQIVPENGEDTLASRWRPDILCEQVDLIFDYFENRTCENCKWYHDNCCTNRSFYTSNKTSVYIQVYEDFGCNRFERKGI